MDRAREKISQFKDDFRRGHIDTYFQHIRAQLVADNPPEQQRKELNQQVTQMLHEQNITELYRLVYHDKKKGLC